MSAAEDIIFKDHDQRFADLSLEGLLELKKTLFQEITSAQERIRFFSREVETNKQIVAAMGEDVIRITQLIDQRVQRGES